MAKAKNKKRFVTILVILLVIILIVIIVRFSAQQAPASTIDFQSKSAVSEKVTESLSEKPLAVRLNPFSEEDER